MGQCQRKGQGDRSPHPLQGDYPPHAIHQFLGRPFSLVLRGRLYPDPQIDPKPANQADLGAGKESRQMQRPIFRKPQAPTAVGSPQIFYPSRLETCSPPTVGGSWVGVRPAPKAEITLLCPEGLPGCPPPPPSPAQVTKPPICDISTRHQQQQQQRRGAGSQRSLPPSCAPKVPSWCCCFLLLPEMQLRQLKARLGCPGLKATCPRQEIRRSRRFKRV